MAGLIIRPSDLTTERANPVASEFMVVDNGVTVAKSKISDVVNSGRPVASQAEAEAGTDATKAMTPLTTKQSIGANAVVAIVAGANTTVDASDPNNPVIAYDGSAVTDGDKGSTIVSGGGGIWTAKTEAATIAAAAALEPTTAPDFIRTAGYTAAGDGGGALYKKVVSEPTHAGKFSITLTDGVTTVWYEIAETIVRPEMFGAVIDASSNQQAALQGMLDTGIREVYLPGGVWRSDGTLTRSDDISICGPGTLDFSNGNGQLLISGSLTQIDDLSANVTKHSQTLEWATDQGLAAQDIVLGYNPTDYSWGSRRAEYRDGFMFRIHSMDGNNARIYDLAVDAYTAADFDIYKMEAPRVTIDGPIFVAGTGSLPAVTCRNCQNVVIRNVKSWGGQGQLVEVDQCFGVDIDCVTPLNNSAFVNDEYGIVIANSHHVHVRGGNPAATRHPVAVGGYGKVGSVPNRYINISGVDLSNNGLGTGVAAMDIHGNSDFVTYENCIAIGGGFGGRNIAYRGCTIFGQIGSASGEALYGAEVLGGICVVESCTVISQGDGGAYGYLHLIPMGPGNGTNRPVETHMRDDLQFIVRDLTLITPNAGALAKAVAVRAQNADKKVNVTIDGINWVAPQGLGFLVADDDTNATLLSDGFVIDNVRGPAGAYVLYPNATTAAVPTREMAQTIAGNATCTSGQSQATGDATNFRHPFSRVPEAIGVAARSTNGAAKSQWGGQFVSPFVYQATATAARLSAASTGGAFSSTEDVRLSGTFGVCGL